MGELYRRAADEALMRATIESFSYVAEDTAMSFGGGGSLGVSHG